MTTPLDPSPSRASVTATGLFGLLKRFQHETPLWFQSLVFLSLLSLLLQLFHGLQERYRADSIEAPTSTISAPEVQIEANGKPLNLLWQKGKQAIQAGEDHIRVIRLWGAIDMDDQGQSPLGSFQNGTDAMSVWRALQRATEDPHTKGVLLWINSPGGTVGMSQELHERVARLKKSKPVLVLFGDVAASGGYMTACGADYIMAPAGSLTGSIGVIMHSMNMQRLFRDKLGIDPVTIKSGQFKDILSNTRSLTPVERVMLQSMIDTSYEQFLSMVLAGRTQHLKSASDKNHRMVLIRSVADGRVLVATDALRYGLVDGIGTYDTAVEKLRQLIAQREGRPVSSYTELPATEDSDALPWGIRQFLNTKLSMLSINGFQNFMMGLLNHGYPVNNPSQITMPATPKVALEALDLKGME